MKKYLLSFLMVFTLLLSNNVVFGATIGQPLLQPENGWQRIDSTNENIELEITTNNKSAYGGSYKSSLNADVSIKFKGTKFRLIGLGYVNGSKNVDVYLDGVKVKNISVYASTSTFMPLYYEVTGLNYGIHTIRFKDMDNNNSTYFHIDAIDIDEDGTLLDPNTEIPPTPEEPEEKPDPKPEEPEPSPEPEKGDRALLEIIMVNGERKEYDMKLSEIEDFISWFDKNYDTFYIINKNYNIGAFTSRKDYVVRDKISSFEVMEYTKN